MKKASTKRRILLGAILVLFLVLSCVYAVLFNESRLVSPMDFSAYVFRAKDLPMILSLSLCLIYVLYLAVRFFLAIAANRAEQAHAAFTRKISPRLGLLGFCGFLGFLGFWTYSVNKTLFSFAFFMFFGFFGFFFEAKLSHTLMDERYRENKVKARLVANQAALTIIFLAVLILSHGCLLGNPEYTLIALLIVLSLAIALEMFLSEYLLYRYDHDEPTDISEE